MARLLAQHLTETMGRSFFIENRPGGGGATGIEAAAQRAAPDGYTLVAVASTMTSRLHVARKTMRFDAVKDFAHHACRLDPERPRRSSPRCRSRPSPSLWRWRKKEPGKLSFASPGLGSTTHMGMELLKSQLGLDMLHVPYNGVAPALTDVLGGRVPVMMVNTVVTKQHLDQNALRALAVRRSSAAESCRMFRPSPRIRHRDTTCFSGFGLLAPAGTPEAIVDQLYSEIAAGLKTPKVERWAETERWRHCCHDAGQFKKSLSMMWRSGPPSPIPLISRPNKKCRIRKRGCVGSGAGEIQRRPR